MKKIKTSIVKCFNSFGHAFKGLYFVLRHENNIWYQIFAGVIAISLGFYFHISKSEWLAIITLTGLVLMAESFNTAIEKMVDLASPEIHPLAGQIKDISAAAVLIISITALVIGCIIYLPYISILFTS